MQLPIRNTFPILSCSSLDEIIESLTIRSSHRDLTLMVDIELETETIGLCLDSIKLNADQSVCFEGIYCSSNGRAGNCYERAEGLIVFNETELKLGSTLDTSRSQLTLILENLA